MKEITVAVKAYREVSVGPETAWSLLSSTAVWSLRRGYFAFDAGTAGSEPIRGLLVAGRHGVAHAVLTLCHQQPGEQEATWRQGARRSAEVTFSARPHRRGAAVTATLMFGTDRGRATYLKKNWERYVGVWLARACEVLEGRQPWPEGMPADVQRACAARPALEATQSVSASVRIAAPPSVVWDAVWAPGSPIDDRAQVACGHVPGTPLQEAGEMQWFVSRSSAGQLWLGTVLVRDVVYQREARIQQVRAPHVEMDYLLVPETDATRLELTHRWAEAAMAGEPGLARNRIAESVRSVAEGYKSAIERTTPTR
jgi:hypothetical protein